MLLPASVVSAISSRRRRSTSPERLQTPVFVMTDLEFGMNTWMSKPFEYPTKPFDRASGLTPEKLKQLGEFARYRDVDGDGIPYRSVPGDGGPRSSPAAPGHNDKALYSERADDYTNNLDRLTKKFDTARTLVPKPEVGLGRPQAASASSPTVRRTGR
jgi:2-oxoglutarate ferredoxin oxidoreductase subunit alpha